MSDSSGIQPIEDLIGVELPGGWRIVERVLSNCRSIHSVSYVAERSDGRRGHVKVLDLEWIAMTDDFVETLRVGAQAFSDERRLLTVANEQGLSRVIRIFASGVLRQPGQRTLPLPYIITELADSDARSFMDERASPHPAWLVQIAHDSATGINQLHSVEIAHQDLKPENVVCFEQRLAKVADLGSAVDPQTQADHVDHDIAGEEMFAPIELLYGVRHVEWSDRRYGCDAYLLGSLIYSLFTGSAMTPAIQVRLHPDHRAARWRGSYSQVLAYVESAYCEVMIDFETTLASRITAPGLRREIVSIVRDLCYPDPNRRGDTIARARGANPYNLERYIARLDLLAKRLMIDRQKAETA